MHLAPATPLTYGCLMKLAWIELRWIGGYAGDSFLPASVRMSGEQDRAVRYLPREDTGRRMTLEDKYLAIALGMLGIAMAILSWWA